MNAKLGVISEICCTFAMTMYFRFPQNRPCKAVWGIFLFLMQRYKKSITLAIKLLGLFELICDYPYLDLMSFSVKKKTVVVLDNASVHRNRKIKELRKIWEDRGLFLFYLPPYSPELNPAEILWRVLKCKWLRPVDYTTTDSLFYATNSALAAVGNILKVNYSL